MAERSRKRSSRKGRGRGDDAAAGAVEDVWSSLVKESQAPPKQPAAAAAGADGSGAAAAPEPQHVSIVEKGHEAFVLFCGSKQAGKSTLISQFLNPSKAGDDAPKPTAALEYTFGRRSNTTSTVKDIAHLWELGGGTHLRELLSVPLTPQRLSSAVVVVVVDLSKPGNVIDSLLMWLQLIRARAKECTDKIGRSNAGKLEKIFKAARARCKLTDEHPDSRVVEPSVVPLIIVAAKYDTFMDVDSARRKVLMAALRYIAHVNGASLICVHKREKALLSHFRGMLNHFVFGTEAKKTGQHSTTKPLIVQPGTDSIESIGPPPGATTADIVDGPESTRYAVWRRAVEAHFPPEPTEEEEDKRAEDEAAKWLESSVDAMRAQKGEELERYIKEAERKLRMEAAKKPSRS